MISPVGLNNAYATISSSLMPIPDFIVEPCTLEHERDALQALMAESIDLPNSHYAVARVGLTDSAILGVIALSPHAQIELLFVHPEHRRKGIATALLQWALDFASALHAPALRYTLPHTSASAEENFQQVALLEKLRFESSDRMKWHKSIPLPIPLVRTGDIRAAVAPEKQAQVIGGKTSAQAHAASLQVMTNTTRDLVCYSRDLDPQVLNTSSVLETLRVIALRTQARLRFLVQYTERATRDGHRLLELSRRLPSSFDFRCAQFEDLQFAGAFLVNDNFGFLLRPLADRYDCEGDLYHIAEANRLRRYFDEVWERSRVISEWRRLSL
jgi:GNAT superfamily N-acetyltransferase